MSGPYTGRCVRKSIRTSGGELGRDALVNLQGRVRRTERAVPVACGLAGKDDGGEVATVAANLRALSPVAQRARMRSAV